MTQATAVTAAVQQPNIMSEEAFNNFTPRAQQVLALARKEADRFNHNYVGTEHLLLGLIKLDQGVAVNVLKKMGLDLETVQMEVEKHILQVRTTRWPGPFPTHLASRRCSTWQPRKPNNFRTPTWEPSTSCWGFFGKGNGVAAKVLRGLDIDLDQTRQEILKEVDPNFQESEEYAASAEDGEKRKLKAKLPLSRLSAETLRKSPSKGDMDR